MKLLALGIQILSKHALLKTVINNHFNFQNAARPIQNSANKQLLTQQIRNRSAVTRRNIHSSKKKLQALKTPDLIYVPHVLRWLKTKFRFKYIQKTLDPDFSEGAFIYGSTQAVCKITEIIGEDKPEKLEGLLTTSARLHLKDVMTYKLTPHQKQIIPIKPGDIKILVPINVSLQNDGTTKTFVVALRSLALKWYEEGAGHFKLVLVALETEFVRHYRDGKASDWTISLFNILECAMLTESSTAAK